MPSFYSNGVPPSHMPSYTPEYAPKFSYNAFTGIQEHQNSYGPYTGVGNHDLSAFASEPYDPYKPVVPPSATLFPSSNAYNNPIVAPIVRPIRVENRHGDSYRHRQGPSNKEHQAKDEPVVGGVSAKLDYDMEMMTDFVSEMASGIIKPGLKPHPNFRKWVLHVLNATRLPAATILTSLHYLSLRVRDLSAKSQFAPAEPALYQLLTVALILGSKFLDDNTFQNKSWAEVSSIKVTELNRDEREWLSAFNHRLHYHPQSPEGFDHWAERWTKFQIRAVTASTTLHAIDTNVQRQRSMQRVFSRSSASPTGHTKQYAKPPTQKFLEAKVEAAYPTPTYTPYDPWFPQRSAVDRSPSTAPHTGPTTPEYYGAQNIWSQDYSQRAQFAFSAMPPIPPQPAPYHTPYSTTYASQYGWNGHAPNCECPYCPRQVPPYMLPGRYGPTVAG